MLSNHTLNLISDEFICWYIINSSHRVTKTSKSRIASEVFFTNSFHFRSVHDKLCNPGCRSATRCINCGKNRGRTSNFTLLTDFKIWFNKNCNNVINQILKYKTFDHHTKPRILNSTFFGEHGQKWKEKRICWLTRF